MRQQRPLERVTRVIDGDTFETSSDAQPVRLEGVDTPERDEPGYQVAKDALRGLVLYRSVDVETKAHDTYGRRVAQVRVGAQSVNEAMRPYSK